MSGIKRDKAGNEYKYIMNQFHGDWGKLEEKIAEQVQVVESSSDIDIRKHNYEQVFKDMGTKYEKQAPADMDPSAVKQDLQTACRALIDLFYCGIICESRCAVEFKSPDSTDTMGDHVGKVTWYKARRSEDSRVEIFIFAGTPWGSSKGTLATYVEYLSRGLQGVAVQSGFSLDCTPSTGPVPWYKRASCFGRTSQMYCRCGRRLAPLESEGKRLED